MSAMLLQWEVTREEWRARYGAYARVALPVAFAVTVSSLIIFYTKDVFWPATFTFGVVYLLIATYFWWEYLRHPITVVLFDDHLTITRSGVSVEYPWSAFAGFMRSNSALVQEAISSRRSRRILSGAQLTEVDVTVEKGREIIGDFYYLMRPWPWWHPFPYTRAVIIGVEPGASEQAHTIIQEKLKSISFELVQKNIDNAGIILGLLIGAAVIAYGFLILPMQ